MYFKLSSQIFHMVDSSVEGMRFTVHVCSEVLVLLNTLGDLVLALRVSRGKPFISVLSLSRSYLYWHQYS